MACITTGPAHTPDNSYLVDDRGAVWADDHREPLVEIDDSDRVRFGPTVVAAAGVPLLRSRAPRCSAAGERGARVSSQFATGRSFDGSGKVQGCTPAAGRSGVPAAVAAAGPRPSETKLGAQPCGRRQERVTPFLRGQDSGGSPSGPSGGLEEHRKGRDDSGTRRCVDERRQWLTWGDVAVRSRGCPLCQPVVRHPPPNNH
jgi:hypothetical protein